MIKVLSIHTGPRVALPAGEPGTRSGLHDMRACDTPPPSARAAQILGDLAACEPKAGDTLGDWAGQPLTLEIRLITGLSR
jgi:hypothetical protein